MRNLAINPILLSDNNTFKFKRTSQVEMNNWPEFMAQIDVFYKGQRIAILNGLSAPLQWTAKNGSNIPIKVVDQLEKMVSKMIVQTEKMNIKQ